MNTFDPMSLHEPSALSGLAPWSPKNWLETFEVLDLGFAEMQWPIVDLTPSHRDVVLAHLLSLNEADRYLRFGYMAHDEQIAAYVKTIDFKRDVMSGVFSDLGELVALSHLALPGVLEGDHPLASREKKIEACAEWGGSVLSAWRGRGLGKRLFRHSCVVARNANVHRLLIQALTENASMIHIVKSHGATLERMGSETQATVVLPSKDFMSQWAQWMSSCYGKAFYATSAQAQRLWHGQVQG
jgi:ribosomal protein S18 acetylase RimI-like enzyme